MDTIKTTFIYNGKSYDDPIEWHKAMLQDAATNPDCDTLVWEREPRNVINIVDGDQVIPVGKIGVGKCAYRGKVYEGRIEYRGTKLYVGGEFVKEMFNIKN